MDRISQFLAVLVFLRRAFSQTHEDIVVINSEPNCYHKGFQYTPDIEGTNAKATDMVECKQKCKDMPECVKFAFFPFTHDCYFGAWYAHLIESKTDGIAGYGECPVPTSSPPKNCKTEQPLDGFPGLTSNASMMAWPSGRQPWSLECWPKDWKSGFMSCTAVDVLEDTTDNWPGKCHKLAKVPGRKYVPNHADTYDLCEDDCRQNPMCASWQTGFYGECWQGMGEDCFVRENFNPVKAQRLQHGEVRVLMDLAGWQIVGLYKAFDNLAAYFIKDIDASSACKRVCYSDIRCQYWLYAPKYGCYVENVEKEYHPPYPLTLDWAYRNTDFALNCIAGEFIQHYCDASQTTVYPTTSAPPLRSCMQVGYQFRKTAYYFVQGNQVERTADDCQARCANEYQCAYFTFWPDGTCVLAGPDAQKEFAPDFRVVTGPAKCHPELETTTTLLPLVTLTLGAVPTIAADVHPLGGAATAIAASAAAGTGVAAAAAGTGVAAAAAGTGAAAGAVGTGAATATLSPAEKSWLTEDGQKALGVPAVAATAATVATAAVVETAATVGTTTPPAAAADAAWLTNEGASALGEPAVTTAAPTTAPATAEETADANWLTAEGQAALGTVPGSMPANQQVVDHAAANVNSYGSVSGTASSAHIQIAQLLVTVRGLNYNALSEAEITTLSEQYAAVIAKGIDEPMTKITDKPHGTPGRVTLQSQPPTSSQIVAYAPNVPAMSLDTSALAGMLYNPTLAASLVAVSKQYANVAAYGTTGPLAATNQMVTMHHRIPNPELSGETGGSGGGLASAWPIMLALGLLVCCGAVVAAVVFLKPKGKTGTRGVNMEDTQTSFLSSEMESGSEMDEGDPGVWASEPTWDNSPKPPPPPPRTASDYGNSRGNFTV